MPWTIDDVLNELKKTNNVSTGIKSGGAWTIEDVEEALKPKPEPPTKVLPSGEMVIRPDIAQKLTTQKTSIDSAIKRLLPETTTIQQIPQKIEQQIPQKTQESILNKYPSLIPIAQKAIGIDQDLSKAYNIATGKDILSGISKERKEEIMKSPTGQFIAGAYEGSPVARTVTAMQKVSTGQEIPISQYAKESRQYSTPLRTIGSLYSGLYEGAAMYGTLGRAVSSLPALQKISSPFLRNIVAGQIADTLIQTPAVALSGIAEKKPAGEVLKDIGKQQALDLAGNILFSGIEAGLGRLKNILSKPISEIPDVNETVIIEKIPVEPTVKATTLQGRYKVKNTALEKALEEYNDAIETIQNYFMTNELRADEVKRIKSELGIDLENIIAKIEKAEQGIKFPTPEEARLRRVAGAADEKTYELMEKLKNIPQPPKIKTQPVNEAQLLEDLKPKTATQPKVISIEPQRPRFTETPKGEIPEGMRERGFSRNVRTDYAMNDTIREALDEEPLVYKQLSNKATQARAEKIFSQGFEAALEDWNRNLGSFRPEDVPLARMLANKAADNGNIELSRKIIADVAEKLTQAGQFSQAARILRQSDPDSFLIYMQRQLNKLNIEGAQKYGKKWKDFNLTDDEIKLIRSMGNLDEAGREEIMEQIYNRIADQMPSTIMEKINAWRRLAMLFNPKTHIRNIGGNVIMKGLRKTADSIGALLENVFLPQAKRTKSIGWSADETIRNAVESSWSTVKKDVIGGTGRWDFKTILGREKRIFKKTVVSDILGTILPGKLGESVREKGFLEFLNKLSGTSLNAEDVIFLEPAYKDALGQFMKARGLKEVTGEAVDYATRRALEATFRDASALANMLNQVKAKGGIAGTLTEAAIPFTKTPINIVKRAYEYSPAGLIGNFVEHAVKKKDPVKLIERLVQGLTGTGITALGFMLSKMGLLSGQPEKSDKYEKFKQASGELPYSIKIFGKPITYDWAQPFAVPLAMGYEIYNAIKDDKDLLETVTDALMAGGDTIFNMSVLQNIRESFAGYSKPTEAIKKLAIDYAKQAVPTLGRQIARTTDETIRSTYDPNELVGLGRYVLSSIPGVSKLLEPKVDVWGREIKQGNLGERALQNLIAPWLVPNTKPTEVDIELKRLYDIYNDTDILPRIIPYSTYKKIDGKTVKYELKPKEVTELQKEIGQNTYNALEKLISSNRYKNASDEVKRNLVENTIDKEWKPWEEFRLARLKAEAEKHGIK